VLNWDLQKLRSVSRFFPLVESLKHARSVRRTRLPRLNLPRYVPVALDASLVVEWFLEGSPASRNAFPGSHRLTFWLVLLHRRSATKAQKGRFLSSHSLPPCRSNHLWSFLTALLLASALNATFAARTAGASIDPLLLAHAIHKYGMHIVNKHGWALQRNQAKGSATPAYWKFPKKKHRDHDSTSRSCR
jgi:hypothetical protein